MRDFTFKLATTIHFGRGQLDRLADLAAYGTRVLLVYGGGSIKRTGVYDAVRARLDAAGLSVFELSGVEPNPKIVSVRAGVEICRAEGIELVLAVGGGSVIDCAKLVAAGARYAGDAWELMEDSARIASALPVFCVLTIAATGSEADDSTVVSNPDLDRKLDICAAPLTPTMSILDPELTFTVSAYQTAAGAVDIMSHVFESYFTRVEGARVQAHLAEALLRSVVESAPAALANPRDYDARANLMWASSLALNGLLSAGAEVKWCVHPIEHELSAVYDVTHGAGLAVLTPHWMRWALATDAERVEPRLAAYGRAVWGIEGEDETAARAAIERTAAFFAELGMPATLRELGIDDARFQEMADHAVRFCDGCYVPMSARDIVAIYRASL